MTPLSMSTEYPVRSCLSSEVCVMCQVPNSAVVVPSPSMACGRTMGCRVPVLASSMRKLAEPMPLRYPTEVDSMAPSMMKRLGGKKVKSVPNACASLSVRNVKSAPESSLMPQDGVRARPGRGES